MDGKTALGASSPANPALHIPEPLSTTKAATSSSHIFIYLSLSDGKLRQKVWALYSSVLSETLTNDCVYQAAFINV